MTIEQSQLERLAYESLETLSYAIFANDGTGRFIYCNQKASEISGYSNAELLQKSVWDLDQKTSADTFQTYWQETQHQPMEFESAMVNRQGKVIPILTFTSYQTLNENEVTFAFVRDISNQKEYENRIQLLNEQLEISLAQTSIELDQSKAILNEMFNGIDVAVCVKDAQNDTILFTNNYAGQSADDDSDTTPFLVKMDTEEAVAKQDVWQGYSDKLQRWYQVYERDIVWKNQPARLQIALDITQRHQIERDLEEQRNLLRSVIDQNPSPVVLKNWEGKYLLGNKAVAELYNLAPEELIGKDETDFLDDPKIGEFFRQNVQAIMRSGQPQTVYEDSFDVKSGEYRNYMSIKKPFKNQKGESQILVVAHDITDIRKAEKTLYLYEKIISASHDMLAFVDKDKRYQAINDAYLTSFRRTREEVVGAKVIDIVKDRARYDNYILPNLEIALNGKHSQYEMWIDLPLQGRRYVDINYFPYTNEQGEIEGVVVNISDITDRKIIEEKLEHLASHDVLTGLANRRLFNERLLQALNRAQHKQQKLAILFIDLDRFKIINDSLGHTIGDEVLKTLSGRLKNAIRVEDTLARSGGDEFLLLIEEYDHTQDIITIANKLLDAFNEPVHIKNNEMYITGSIGISLYPEDASTPEELIQLADTAMYQAKRAGRNSYQFAHQELREEAFERFFLENHLRAAIEKEEFEIYLQPQHFIETETLCGAEVLLRWKHSEIGMIGPDRFIPVAEETGLIIPIGNWVLDQACGKMKSWLDKGFTLPKIAVNIAGPQLLSPNMVDTVQQILEKHELEAKYLELEITESYLMEDKALVANVLSRLREMGISISIDDFGTGYSSLSYLQKLPISKLKIDQTFVRDVPGDEDDRAIVKTIIALADNLKMMLIAEGVETKEQADYLLQNGCRKAQGYYYAKPMPANAFEIFLNTVPTQQAKPRK